MSNPLYTVRWTETALKLARAVQDRKVRALLVKRAGQLAREPERQGKPLVQELAGFYSVRAVGQRFRIIYQIQQREVVVAVAAVGRRKAGDRADIYALAKKLLRQGLLSR